MKKRDTHFYNILVGLLFTLFTCPKTEHNGLKTSKIECKQYIVYIVYIVYIWEKLIFTLKMTKL